MKGGLSMGTGWSRGKGTARALLAMLALVAAWGPAWTAEAQQILASSPPTHDRVRVSGFFWRATPGGGISFDELAGFPGFEDGIDIDEQLGFVDPTWGWILEGNFAAGRRHRFIVELSNLETMAGGIIDFPGAFPIPEVQLVVDTELNLREFHAFYNFLIVARPTVEFGVLGGMGWFDADASLVANIGTARAGLRQAFPSIGGNVLINPRGPVRGYFEISGFPHIEIDELSGDQLDLMARIEVFPVRWLGLLFGYRRYQLEFNRTDDFAIDLSWDGLVFGAQFRY